MNNVGLGTYVLNDSARIVEAIQTGAAWEIWMQVEFVLIMRGAGLQAAREVPYPSPSRETLDLLARDAQGSYAIELKVESANNSGSAIINGINLDRAKIAHYPPQNPGARWVLGIGYSAGAMHAMQAFANNPANNAIYGNQGGIGVVVATV